MYQKSTEFREKHTFFAHTKAEAYTYLESGVGFVECFIAQDPSIEKELKDKYSVTVRCIPLETLEETGPCIFTDKKGQKALLAKAY